MLHIDPSEPIGRGVTHQLKRVADVTWAPTFAEGLELIARDPWDAIITERDEGVVRFARSIDHVAYVLVYTNDRRVGDRRFFKKLGAELLEKPDSVRARVQRGILLPMAWRNHRRLAITALIAHRRLGHAATKVFLRTLEGLDPEEIADDLGLSINTIYGSNEEIVHKMKARSARAAAEKFHSRVRFFP